MCSGNFPPQRGQIFSTWRVAFGEKFVWATAVWLAKAFPFCPKPKPQRPQNFEAVGRFAEQRGQVKDSCPTASLTIVNERFPQRPQNLTPSAKRA